MSAAAEQVTHSEMFDISSFEDSDQWMTIEAATLPDQHDDHGCRSLNENGTGSRSIECTHESPSAHKPEHLDSIASVTVYVEDQQDPVQPKRKKPYRPCPFCMKMQSKLSNHLQNKHKSKPEVKQALLLPDQDRFKAFDRFKKKGILLQNIKLQKDGCGDNFLRERSQGNRDLLVYCSKCFGHVSKQYFPRHKRICSMSENSTIPPLAIKTKLSYKPENIGEFETLILNSFREDEVGMVCITDDLIVNYGRREFTKTKHQIDKKDEKRKSVKINMRRLGNLFLKFKDVCSEESISCASSVEMFSRENFNFLVHAINELTIEADGTIKTGAKIAYGYLIKNVGKYIYGEHLINKKDEEACEINRFLDVLGYHWAFVFGDAEYTVVKNRQTNLRKPTHLPNEDDVKKLRDYTIDNIQIFDSEDHAFNANSDYTLLRDVLVCRLTLFNARRGGEPSRLLLSELQDAFNDVWVKHNVKQINDPLEKLIIGRFKVAFQSGKRDNLVPVLIIDDCWKALKCITDKTVREKAGVHHSNPYAFPSTQQSDKHVLGWYCVNRCCVLAELKSNLTATQRRHHVSTIYAGLEVSEDDRETFYQHMGHSAHVNRSVYQSPLAVREITQMGKFFDDLDKDRPHHVTVPNRVTVGSKSHQHKQDIIASPQEPPNFSKAHGKYMTEKSTSQTQLESDTKETEREKHKTPQRHSITAKRRLKLSDESPSHSNRGKTEPLENSSYRIDGIDNDDDTETQTAKQIQEGNRTCKVTSNVSTLGKTPQRHSVVAKRRLKLTDESPSHSNRSNSEPMKNSSYRIDGIDDDADTETQTAKQIQEGNRTCKVTSNVSTLVLNNEDVDDDNYQSDASCTESDPNSPNIKQKKRLYRKWSSNDTKTVTSYFSQYINNSEHLYSNKGPNPSFEEIRKFLAKNPFILPTSKLNDRIRRVSSKIFNDRKVMREKIRNMTAW